AVVATDQEVEIIAAENLENIESCGETTVPFRKLHEICKALPEHAELFLETPPDQSADKITIKAGRSRFVLATLPASQFPDVQNISKNQRASNFSVPKK